MKKNDRAAIIKAVIRGIHQEASLLEDTCLQIAPLIKEVEGITKEAGIFYNRAAGSVLHDFYTGLEKIFCDISNKINGGLPKGEDWHIKLLRNMAEQNARRPTVISSGLMEELKEYLGFRHLFRNIYGAQLDWSKLKELLMKLQGDIWPKTKEALELFIKKVQEGARTSP